jgi:hypothetical protein
MFRKIFFVCLSLVSLAFVVVGIFAPAFDIRIESGARAISFAIGVFGMLAAICEIGEYPLSD